MLEGEVDSSGNHLVWSLCCDSDDLPLLLLQKRFHDIGFPKAKALVGRVAPAGPNLAD